MVDLIVNNPTEIVGLAFQVHGINPTPELWQKCKQDAIGELSKQPHQYSIRIASFYTVFMPCGSFMEFYKPHQIFDLPIEDIPCGCGDKTHWFIRFIAI